MGQEESSLIDESVEPLTLKSRDLASLAIYLQSPKCCKITVLTGAGISTSAGIPDFRSPETGLYANLARLNLPYAEAVFSIEYFRQNPEPFYMLAHELYPGKFRPTITHSFIYLLHEKGVLLKHFTQNIDCLDREAGLPGDMAIEAHGSFASQRCIDCKLEYPTDMIKEHVHNKKIPRCLNKDCNGLVKPDIVFFGEALPTDFFLNRHLVEESDLVIVLGTSLQVQPFASLPSMASEGTPRLLINLEQVGGLGGRADDVLLLEDCDGGVRKLAEACGWLEELEELWKKTGKSFDAPTEGAEGSKTTETEEGKTSDRTLEAEVEKLTREIDEVLKLNKEHESDAYKVVAAREKGREEVTKERLPTTATAPLTEMTPDAKEDEPSNGTEEASKSGGLSHIFPNVDKKSSL